MSSLTFIPYLLGVINISCKVDTIECISKRLCAVKVTVDDIEFVLFNMYMPCDKGYANHEFF